MGISDEQIARFQDLYKEQFGEEISKGEALKRGSKLVGFVRAIYELNEYEENRRNKEI